MALTRILQLEPANQVRACIALDTVGTMRSQIGATRVGDMLSGEQLPRIC